MDTSAFRFSLGVDGVANALAVDEDAVDVATALAVDGDAVVPGGEEDVGAAAAVGAVPAVAPDDEGVDPAADVVVASFLRFFCSCSCSSCSAMALLIRSSVVSILL